MPKELYIYGGIYSFTAEDFIRQFEENKNSDIVIRMNTNGGDPQASWGMIAKMKEHKKDVSIKVDGKAISTGFYMLPHAKHVRALNTSSFLIHRAAYASWYEKDYMTAEEKADLERINADLRKSLEAKVDPIKFQLVTGFSLDQIFDMSTRIDVRLNAEQMKNLGLVDEVVDVVNEQKIAAEGKIYFDDEPLFHAPGKPVKAEEKTDNKNQNPTTMTKEEFKLKYPDAYASIVKESVTAERDRVGAWMAFADVDIEAVKKGIDEGKDLSPKVMAELSRKSFSKQALAEVKDESAETVQTPEAEAKEKTKKEKEVESFLTDVRAELKK